MWLTVILITVYIAGYLECILTGFGKHLLMRIPIDLTVILTIIFGSLIWPLFFIMGLIGKILK